MKMKCQTKYSNRCKNPQTCQETGAEPCFKPFPPRMTNEEFATQQAELLKDVPEEFKSAMSYMAYEDGHSAGHEEVINILRGLVSDLLPSIKAFEKRLKT